MLHPFKPLISRFDGLQLAANQPGFKAFKANSPAPLREGKVWKAGERGSGEAQFRPPHYSLMVEAVGRLSHQNEVSITRMVLPTVVEGSIQRKSA